MRWKAYRLDDGSIAQNTICSDTGYAVLRCTSQGRVTGRFLAFHVAFNGSRVVLGGYDSRDEACQACEAHCAQNSEVVA